MILMVGQQRIFQAQQDEAQQAQAFQPHGAEQLRPQISITETFAHQAARYISQPTGQATHIQLSLMATEQHREACQIKISTMAHTKT